MSNEASGPLSDPCEVPIDMVSDNWHSRDIIVFITCNHADTVNCMGAQSGYGRSLFCTYGHSS